MKFHDLLTEDLTRRAERFGGWLGLTCSRDPQEDAGDDWRDETWTDALLRESENERRAA